MLRYNYRQQALCLLLREFRVDDDRDWRRHEQGRHSRRDATASGWLWCTLAAWSVAKVWVDVDCDWRRHEQDGIPDVLQQPQVGYSVPVPYGAPVGAAPTFQTVTALSGYQYGAPQEVQYAVAPTVTKKKRGACC